MKDFIIKLLDLKEEDLDSIDSITQWNQADFLITLKTGDHVCPKCGAFTHYVKDYKIRKLKHKILINFDSTIFYNQRRYVCKNCNATFVENAPFTGNRNVMTLLLSLIFLMILNHIPLPILQQPKNMMLQFLQLLIYSISMSKYL